MNPLSRRARWPGAIAAMVGVALTVTACGDGGSEGGDANTNQAGLTGEPIKVMVTAPQGNPLADFPGVFAGAQAAALALPWLVTECTGTDDGALGTFAWDSLHLVVDAVDAGSTGLMMWNLALSPGWRGAFGGCHTCRGLLTVDGPADGSVADGNVAREPEFFTLAHLRRAAPAGSRAAEVATSGPLLATGFRAPGRAGVYGFNASDDTLTVRVRTVDGSLASTHTVGPFELFTWVGRS